MQLLPSVTGFVASYLFSQSDVDLDCLIISIGYLTSVGPCGWCDALSPVQTYDLIASVAIEALLSITNGNLDSTGVVVLPKPIWYCSTTLFLVSPTVECTSTLSNVSQREDTVIEVDLPIQLKVYPYTQLAVIRCRIRYNVMRMWVYCDVAYLLGGFSGTVGFSHPGVLHYKQLTCMWDSHIVI